MGEWVLYLGFRFSNRMQIPYPLIALVTRMPHTLLGKCPISIRCRTFETITLSFGAEQDATDVFDSVKDLTVSSTFTVVFPRAGAAQLTGTLCSSVCHPVVRVRVHAKSTISHTRWLDAVFATRGVRAHGRRLAHEGLAVHGHQ